MSVEVPFWVAESVEALRNGEICEDGEKIITYILDAVFSIDNAEGVRLHREIYGDSDHDDE